MSVDIPPGFKELLKEFTIAVLRKQPENLVNFAVNYFKELHEAQESSQTVTPQIKKNDEETEDEDSNSSFAEPPPNRGGSRRVAVAGESFDPEKDDETDLEPIPIYPKSDIQKERLKDAVRHILLFRCLDDEQLHNVIDAMFERVVEPEDVIITQVR